jgi:colanic acid/amylovoran biosynthesis protein
VSAPGLRRFLKRVRAEVIDSPTLFARRQEREAAHFARLTATLKPAGGRHLVLAPSDRGNVGDQAMLEAFFENVCGPITVIEWNPGDVKVPTTFADEVSTVSIPRLTASGLTRPQAALEAFAALLHDAASFSVVGADVLDGAYSYTRSVRRASLTTYAARAGVPARILGFSWNENPDPRALEAIRQASAAGVRLFARDPVSARRLRVAVPGIVEEAADLVFSARSCDEGAMKRVCPGLSGPYVVLNANGIIGQTFDQAPDYARLVRWLLERGMSVVLVPHDDRPRVDDVEEARRVRKLVEGPVWLVDRLLAPEEIRGLVSGAACVFTGRMHLSIMSLWSGVPPVTLDRQGKVEGLMEVFGLRELLVTPRPGLADAAIGAVRGVLADQEGYRARVAAGLARAKELSLRNFDGLPLR